MADIIDLKCILKDLEAAETLEDAEDFEAQARTEFEEFIQQSKAKFVEDMPDLNGMLHAMKAAATSERLEDKADAVRAELEEFITQCKSQIENEDEYPDAS